MSSASHATGATNPRDSELLEIDTREVPLTAPADTPPKLAHAFEGVADALFRTAELLQAPAPSARAFELQARRLSDVWRRARDTYGKVELLLQSVSAPEGACAHQDALNIVGRVVDATGHAILRKVSSEEAIAYLSLVPRFDLASILSRMRRQIGRAGIHNSAVERPRRLRGERRRRTEKTVREAKMDARDKWIYERCCAGCPHKEIVAKLGELGRQESWFLIRSVQGVRAAALSYARRNGLPRPPERLNL
jgi:hypothetical protein